LAGTTRFGEKFKDVIRRSNMFRILAVVLTLAVAFAADLPKGSGFAAKGTIPEDSRTIAPPLLLPDYLIGPGDILQINVWKEPDASSPAVVVRSDGKISLPILKEVTAAGYKPAELEKILTEKISKVIHGADVTVLVREVHSEKVYLIGAVRREGPIPLKSSMTILQAIAQAGGLTDYAKRTKIYVLRRQGESQQKLPFDYTAVIKGEHMEQNVVLLPDDTVVIPH
jgi:polysaccharide export outer membrane protein